ncbi:class I poly(R)-hydroxyalkanoic acid synthase [Aureimonas mangrovi]|uniref:class I poly(R)-hydroxyalkanoic acid synthase n=1 Tax=Aureimonas mangrovi TaxID=2758041 RepID=UPI00163DC5EE|nr:class I poly(R)-hydroxyalkanoic acid synthase [Aureimonas mangrovi]
MSQTHREPPEGPPPGSDYLVRDPEAFARNMAHVLENLGKAAAAWVEPRERGRMRDPATSIYGEMVSTLSKVGQYWLSEPGRALEAQTYLFAGYLDIWSRSIRRMSGDPQETTEATPPARGDKRFSDEEWQRNPFFDFLRQVYTLTTRWADDLVTKAEGLDPHTRQKAAFYVRQISNALSPSNFVLTNPELYRETLEQNGENLVRGMKMFAEDMTAGAGVLKLRQSDVASFEVGRNIATTPGSVIAQNELCQIIQYAPATKTVRRRPILISPPWINKFYILDLNAEKSFIGWLVEQGDTVFVVSWVNPDARHMDRDWQAYIEEGLVFGLDTIEAVTGESEVDAIGYCVGGTLLACGAAYMKARGDERIRTLTLLATQVDFAHAGDLLVFVDEGQLKALEETMTVTGTLAGTHMATAFNLLRSGELIWPYFVDNYLKGKEPLPFDLLYWNSDATRMTRANHMFYLRNCYLENRITKGEMRIGDVDIDLRSLTIPVYNLATREDHIAPAKSVYAGSTAFAGQVTYVMSGSGHIAGVVNPPAKNKYQFWTGEEPSEAKSFEDWAEAAKETKGSWWPHWQAWLKRRSPGTVPARPVGGKDHAEIEPAPGSYVRAR